MELTQEERIDKLIETFETVGKKAKEFIQKIDNTKTNISRINETFETVGKKAKEFIQKIDNTKSSTSQINEAIDKSLRTLEEAHSEGIIREFQTFKEKIEKFRTQFSNDLKIYDEFFKSFETIKSLQEETFLMIKTWDDNTNKLIQDSGSLEKLILKQQNQLNQITNWIDKQTNTSKNQQEMLETLKEYQQTLNKQVEEKNTKFDDKFSNLENNMKNLQEQNKKIINWIDAQSKNKQQLEHPSA